MPFPVQTSAPEGAVAGASSRSTLLRLRLETPAAAKDRSVSVQGNQLLKTISHGRRVPDNC